MANIDFFGGGGDSGWEDPVPNDWTPPTGSWGEKPVPSAPKTDIPTLPGQPASGQYGTEPVAGDWTDPAPQPNPTMGWQTPGQKPSAQDFIRNWQASHPVSEGIGPLEAAMKAAGYTNVTRFMYGATPSNNELAIDGQKYKVLGGEGTPAAYWYAAGTNDGGGNAGGYTDANSKLYLDELMRRLVELRKPVDDPFQNMLQLFAQKRIKDLSGDPYTAGDDAAMVAHYRDPLTQARDASLQRNKERIGARGMAPTSGLLDVLNRETNADYTKGLAQGTNDLAVRAVTEKQRRQDEILSIFGNLMNVNRSSTDRQNALYDQALEVAKRFPDFDMARFNMLMQASGDGPSSSGTMANLTSLANLGLNTNTAANAQSQANSQIYGQFLAWILAQMNKK